MSALELLQIVMGKPDSELHRLLREVLEASDDAPRLMGDCLQELGRVTMAVHTQYLKLYEEA